MTSYLLGQVKTRHSAWLSVNSQGADPVDIERAIVLTSSWKSTWQGWWGNGKLTLQTDSWDNSFLKSHPYVTSGLAACLHTASQNGSLDSSRDGSHGSWCQLPGNSAITTWAYSKVKFSDFSFQLVSCIRCSSWKKTRLFPEQWKSVASPAVSELCLWSPQLRSSGSFEAVCNAAPRRTGWSEGLPFKWWFAVGVG